MEVYEITGKVRLLSGLHIGGGNAFSAIGAVDSQVIRDQFTRLPIIPGSSLKGKLRTLLSQKIHGKSVSLNDEENKISRLFGSVQSPSRLIFRDLLLSNLDELQDKGLQGSTEVKFENSIKRITAEANPRQIERVVRGSEFDLEIIYQTNEVEDILEDLENLKTALRLIELNYLGGHGSRGSGRIEFIDLELSHLSGEGVLEIDEDFFEEFNQSQNH